MLRYHKTGLLGAALVALPLVAAAADSAEPPEFDSADANGDGVVSVEEAVEAGVPEAEAKREDIDGDGELTKADWKFVDMSPETTQAGGSADSSQ